MSGHSIKYGIDRCPATKNYTQSAFCHHCDFRGTEEKDCCECTYHKIGNRDRRATNKLH